MPAIFLFQNIFFSESDFCTNTSHFFNTISEMFCNFLLQLSMAERRHLFLALWVRKRKNKIKWGKAKFALTCSFEKLIRMPAVREREKFENSVNFKVLDML